jgi:hypothetical protein
MQETLADELEGEAECPLLKTLPERPLSSTVSARMAFWGEKRTVKY